MFFIHSISTGIGLLIKSKLYQEVLMTKIQNSVLLFGFGVSVLLACANVDASLIDIKNSDVDGRKVDVIIEPGSGTILPNKRSIKIVLDNGEEEKVDVRKDLFKNNSFTVTGVVTMPSTVNKCSSLQIDTDYEIVFTKSKSGGIECTAKALY